MEFHRVDLKSCHQSTGIVVVIDVCRAFTTAAFALAAGAERIILVESVEDALRLRAVFPDSITMGELGGFPVPGFDLWNSPTQVQAMGARLEGRTVIQRTSAGTQGVVRSASAEHLYAASLVVAAATARSIRALAPTAVTYVLTGWHDDKADSGMEDAACAAYLTALLEDHRPNPQDYLAWKPVLQQNRFDGAPEELVRQFAADLELCAWTDHFDFAMRVERQDGLLILNGVDESGRKRLS